MSFLWFSVEKFTPIKGEWRNTEREVNLPDLPSFITVLWFQSFLFVFA